MVVEGEDGVSSRWLMGLQQMANGSTTVES